jgi:hypothetical protein
VLLLLRNSSFAIRHSPFCIPPAGGDYRTVKRSPAVADDIKAVRPRVGWKLRETRMMMLVLLLNAITNWATPPPPIQGFDRWEPAALFWMGERDGVPEVVEGPNHDKLIVKKVRNEDRSFLEFDLEALPDEFDLITLNILIGNLDPDPPIEVVEFFHYSGDGEEDVEDWDTGEYFWTYDYPGDGKYRLRLDVTNLVRSYRDVGQRYLGFRLSAPRFARFSIGKGMAINDPNPFFAVHHAGARTDSSDIQPFVECMFGPADLYAARCPLLWDYNDDDIVDLGDFAIFQAMFDE